MNTLEVLTYDKAAAKQECGKGCDVFNEKKYPK